MYGYIYMTINVLNGKRYIGQKKSDKFLTKYSYVGSGKLLWRSINKYGIENFAIELLDTANSKNELNDKEIYWIDYYDATNDPMFYNIQLGGNGGDITKRMTNEEYNRYRYKISDNLKGKLDFSGEKNPFYGKHHSDATRSKISYCMRHLSAESRQKMIDNHADVSGSNNPMYGVHRYGSENPFYGKKHSEESRKKMSEALSGENHPNYGKHLSDSTRSKISKALKGKKRNYSSTKGRRLINNGITNKYVFESDLQSYLDNGWELGRLKRQKEELI